MIAFPGQTPKSWYTTLGPVFVTAEAPRMPKASALPRIRRRERSGQGQKEEPPKRRRGAVSLQHLKALFHSGCRWKVLRSAEG